MVFCDRCENLLVINHHIDEASGKHHIVNSCSNCGPALDKELPSDKSLKIIENKYQEAQTNYETVINPYIKFDPRLPRVKNIKCTNADCKLPTGEENEVIYIKYDKINMKYVYVCVHCDHYWILKD